MLKMAADLGSMVIQLVLGGIVMGRFIETKHRTLFTLLMVLIEGGIYWLCGYMLPQADALKSVLTTGSMLLLVLLFRRIPAIQTVLYLAVYMICIMITEIPTDLMLLSLHPGFRRLLDLSVMELIITRMVYLPFYLLSLLIPYWICTRLIRKVQTPGTGKYLPFLAVQSVMVMLPVWMGLSVLADKRWVAVLSFFYMVINLLLDLMLIRTFRRMERAYALERQEQEAQALLEAQAAYYRRIQDSAKALEQVRLEMRDRLRALSGRLEQGDYAEAQRQLSDFRETVDRTGRQQYTGSNVVDAVIASKISGAEAEHIRLQISGAIPQDIGIQPVHLCSIAGNLLDNAIHACEKLPPEQQRTIELDAHMKGRGLVFSCRNPRIPGQTLRRKAPDLSQEHGWGLNILESIAQQYGGGMTIQEHADTVQVLLWLTPEGGRKEP